MEVIGELQLDNVQIIGYLNQFNLQGAFVMDGTLKIIAKFLEDFEPEVQAHGADVLTSEMENSLSRFVRGELPEDSRDDLFREVLRNRKAMNHLVKVFKDATA